MNVLFLLFAGFSVAALTYIGGVLYTRYQNEKSHQKILPSVIAAGGGYLIAISLLELLPLSIARHPDRLHEIAGFAILGMMTVSVSHRAMGKALRFWNRLQRKGSSMRFHPVKASGHLPNRPLVYRHTNIHDHPGHAEGDTCCKPMIGVPVAQAAIGCVIVCSFFDGVMVTSGFQAGERIGLGIYIGQLLHSVPEGIIAASLAIASGQSTHSSKKAAFIVSTSFFFGSVFPFLISSQPHWIIPFSLGIVLSVTLGQLLPMIGKRPASWTWLFGGAGFYSAIHLILEN